MSTSRPTQRARQSPVAPQRLSRTLLLATDLQQSVLAELDRTNPNRFAYPPYGSQSGPRQAGTHLGFNGQLRERSTGWYHLGNGHRVYNPVLMRFHSADRLSPFGEGGINTYAYCVGDPVNLVDPTGEYGQAIARLVQLGATTALHAGIVTTNLVGAKVTGWMLLAGRISTVASSTAIIGSVGQLAGWSAAVYVSNVATVASAAATMLRYVPLIFNGVRARTLWNTVRNNVRNLVWGTAFPTPDVSPSAIPAGQNAAGVSIPMQSVSSTSTSTSTSTSLDPSSNALKIRQT